MVVKLERSLFCLMLLILVLSCRNEEYPISAEIVDRLPEKVDYNFHVKPILSDRCYSCHGPDEKTRKANLRLDIEEDAFAKLTSGSNEHAYAIHKKKPGKSEIIARLYSEDPALIMPPLASKLFVSDYEKAILQKWIKQGAEWKPHWAFSPPTKKELPLVENKNWPKNEIDYFVLAKLEKEELTFSEPADKERLLRRVYLDLTGLPPTIQQMDQFLNDPSENAYEKVVDELLASKEYAERMTLEWLDVARYADSHGLHADGWRNMWPWRDWVIEAFNSNMPYDQFITEQLAGDLLPDKSPKKILATAFNRNHPMTGEGGAVDEEFRLEYVFDRTSTVATAFMGLTMACARCHDHKFDPITQKEFFQMASFFNNVKELGMTGDDGNYGPMLLLPDDNTAAKIQHIQKEISKKEQALNERVADLKQTEKFIQSLKDNSKKLPIPDHHYPIESISKGTVNKQKNTKMVDGNNRTSIAGEVEIVEGKYGNAYQFNSGYDVLYLYDVGQFDVHTDFSISAWINTDKDSPNETQTIIGNAGEKNNFWRGWDFFIDSTSRLSARMISGLPHNYIQVTSENKIKTNEWTQVALSYDGSGKAKGLRIYINGKACETEINFDNLYKNIRTLSVKHQEDKRGLRVAKSYRGYTGEYGIFSGKIDEIKIFNRHLSHLEISQLNKPIESQKQMAADPTKLDRMILLDHLNWTIDLETKKLRKEIQGLLASKIKLQDDVEEVMVMKEMSKPRPMYVLDRGSYENPTVEVKASTPAAVLSFADDYEKNRLGFAKWLTDEKNPLTARVTVNRYWQMIFGRGIVDTPQDFGIQGSLPSHPNLLDYLAVDFMASGWNVKALLKKIVTSATYQQSSKASELSKEKDPYNVYLSHGASYRLQAELIRDNALAASGLLKKQLGGPSVRPYQPEGLWIDKGSFSNKLLRYKASSGDSLYRRSMYTFIKRTSPHPSMVAFDAPDRSICTVKRENTNTPLQALVLLNDPQFMEAAKALAVRVQSAHPDNVDQQLALAFRRLTGRKAITNEVQLFKEHFTWQKNKFEQDPTAVKEILSIGQFKITKSIDAINTAALTAVISTMISHDESYTKR